MWKKKKFSKRKIKKCAEGAISLFLVVTMLPFLSIASLMIETNRFNSTVSVLDEMMGSAAVSTLSDYDRFLLDRFGVLAMTQERPMNLTYQNYIEQNAGIMGASLDLKRINANGEYPLSDPEMLMHQLMEFSALNAPAQLTTGILESIGLQELVDTLEGIGNIGTIFDIISAGSGVLEETKDLFDNFGEFKSKADEFAELQKTYDTKYQEFSDAVIKLAKALKEPRPTEEDFPVEYEEEEDETTEEYSEEKTEEEEKEEKDKKKEKEKTPEEIEKEEKEKEEKRKKAEQDAADKLASAQKKYDNNINKLKGEVATARTNYLDVNQSIINKLQSYKSLIEENEQALSSITGALTELGGSISQVTKDKISDKKELLKQTNEDLKNYSSNDPAGQAGLDFKIALEGEIAEMETEQTLYDATRNAVDGIAKGYEDSLGDYTVQNVQKYINAFSSQMTNVRTKFYTSPGCFMTSNNYSNYINGINGYHTAIGGYIPKNKVNEYFESQRDEFIDGSFSALLEGLKGFYESIFSMKGICDPELAANIDVALYNREVGGLPGGSAADSWVMRIVKKIGDIIQSADDLRDEIVDADNLWESIKEWVNPFQKLIDIIDKIIKLIDTIKELIEELVSLVAGIVENILSLFKSPDRLFLCTYSTYNMPCRNDGKSGVASFSAMTGKSFGGDKYFHKGSTTGFDTFDSILAMIDTIETLIKGTGKDMTFRACDMEYILFGSMSEMANQMSVFAGLYVLRFLLDAAPVIMNAEVQSLAAASTLGYPIVIALIAFLEPLADALILVNGGSVPLIKTTVYLTPSGVGPLAEKFINLKLDHSACSSALNSAFGATDDDVNYQSTLRSKSGSSMPKLELFPMSYQDHCLLLMMISVTKEQQLARIQNIMQMESYYYYRTNKGFSPFKLKESFTFINSEVTAKVKNFLPLPSLSVDSLFTATRKQLRGY